jgi:predicted MFS family arabinose efflux permease
MVQVAILGIVLMLIGLAASVGGYFIYHITRSKKIAVLVAVMLLIILVLIIVGFWAIIAPSQAGNVTISTTTT